MEFAILGPLRVGGPDGPIRVGAPKQRALLAMLLLAYREDGVSTSRLIDALWDEDPPATAAKALQVHVSHLRRAIGAETIVTRANGYAIEVEPGQLDLERFETLVARAAEAPPADAGTLLREALALFRGPPLVDAPLYGPAATEADRLAELRLAALERRIEFDLQAGRAGELVAELDALTAEHPYWVMRGNVTEGRELLDATAALESGAVRAARARAQRRRCARRRAGRLRRLAWPFRGQRRTGARDRRARARRHARAATSPSSPSTRATARRGSACTRRRPRPRARAVTSASSA